MLKTQKLNWLQKINFAMSAIVRDGVGRMLGRNPSVLKYSHFITLYVLFFIQSTEGHRNTFNQSITI
jgi:hypothetical protein